MAGRRVRPYAIAFVLLVGIAVLSHSAVPVFGLFLLPLWCFASVMLGGSTLPRRRWPERTATEKVRCPTSRDLIRAASGIVRSVALFAGISVVDPSRGIPAMDGEAKRLRTP